MMGAQHGTRMRVSAALIGLLISLSTAASAYAAVDPGVTDGREAAPAATPTDNYAARRLAGHVLHARGYAAEARVLLEELGDDALASSDAAGAARAYLDAAWIAQEEALRRDAEFDYKSLGVGVMPRPETEVAEVRRLLALARDVGGSESVEAGGLSVGEGASDYDVRLQVGRQLHALGKHNLAVAILEELGDDALAVGRNVDASQAYREALWIAYQQAQRRIEDYDFKLVGIAQPSVKGYSEVAIRLADKARSAGVSS